MHSFNLNVSPEMSYGALECESVMGVLFVPDPVYDYNYTPSSCR